MGIFAVVQSLSHVWFSAIPWTAGHQASLPSPSPRVCSNSCTLSHGCYLTISSSANLFFCLQSFPASASFPMSLLFTSGSQSTGTSTLASGLPVLSFRIDCFDLLAVQGTLKSLLQHHGLKASILWCSAFFMDQFSYLYMTTGKNIALTILFCRQSDVFAF